MSPLEVFFSILAPILYLIGFVPYIYHAFHGRVVPHAFTWTVGGVLSWINLYALYHSQGVDFSLLGPSIRSISLILGAMVGWMLISRIHIGWFDIFCLILAIGTIGGAYLFGIENAIIPTILIDILVLTPTIRKIWRDPDTEDAFAWMLVVASQAAYLLSLSSLTLTNSLFWGYIMSINALVAILIVRRRVYTHRWLYRMKLLLTR